MNKRAGRKIMMADRQSDGQTERRHFHWQSEGGTFYEEHCLTTGAKRTAHILLSPITLCSLRPLLHIFPFRFLSSLTSSPLCQSLLNTEEEHTPMSQAGWLKQHMPKKKSPFMFEPEALKGFQLLLFRSQKARIVAIHINKHYILQEIDFFSQIRLGHEEGNQKVRK